MNFVAVILSLSVAVAITVTQAHATQQLRKSDNEGRELLHRDLEDVLGEDATLFAFDGDLSTQLSLSLSLSTAGIAKIEEGDWKKKSKSSKAMTTSPTQEPTSKPTKVCNDAGEVCGGSNGGCCSAGKLHVWCPLADNRHLLLNPIFRLHSFNYFLACCVSLP